MPIELEAKLQIPNRKDISAQLRQLGATCSHDVFERNLVFDTSHIPNENKGMLLRLRTHDDEKGGIITIKRHAGESSFKRMEEDETAVADADMTELILTQLGFSCAWKYEKKRSTWNFEKCEIMLDELPEIGCFIEVEGANIEDINACLHALNLDPKNHIAGNYRSIYYNHCAEHNKTFGNLCFDSQEST